MTESIIKYPYCKDFKRTIPNLEVTQEAADAIGTQYRTLPIFEKGLYEYTYRKHYSLETNQLLKCRWKEFKKTFEQRIREPVQFPNVRDFHFHNAQTRLIPSQTIYTKPEPVHRRKLNAGPGVDFRGQMPIPQELFMKRGTQTKKDKPKKAGTLSKAGAKIKDKK